MSEIEIKPLPGARVTVCEDGRLMFERWQIDAGQMIDVAAGDNVKIAHAILDWLKERAALLEPK